MEEPLDYHRRHHNQVTPEPPNVVYLPPDSHLSSHPSQFVTGPDRSSPAIVPPTQNIRNNKRHRDAKMDIEHQGHSSGSMKGEKEAGGYHVQGKHHIYDIVQTFLTYFYPTFHHKILAENHLFRCVDLFSKWHVCMVKLNGMCL